MKTTKGFGKTAAALAVVAVAFVGVAPFANADETSDATSGDTAISSEVEQVEETPLVDVPAAQDTRKDLDEVVAPAAVNSTSVGARANNRISDNAINTQSREAVREAYVTRYLAADQQVVTSIGADTTKCKPGTVNPEAADMVMDAWNFFRGLNNLDAVSTDPASPLSDYMQKAALTQAAAGMSGKGLSLSHYPTPSQGYPCADRDAYLGSQHANLAQSIGHTPAHQIQWWFQDWSGTGVSTMTSEGFNDKLGHRSWLMDPYVTESAYGNVAGYNALAVNNGAGLDNFSTDRMTNVNAVVPETMAWPSAGYFPAELLTAYNKRDVERWSFHIQNADVSNATVTVTGPKGNVPVRVVKQGMRYAPTRVANYGTILIKMDPKTLTMPVGQGNAIYTIKVNNVKNAAKTSYTYQVKLFNASEVDAKPRVVVSGKPFALQNNSTIPADVRVIGSDAKLQWQLSEDKGKTWKDAERIEGKTMYAQPNQLRWSPGLGTCLRQAEPRVNNTCPMTIQQTENMRFRLRATNDFGTTYSEPIQAVYLGIKTNLPKEVKAGQKLSFELAFDGNGDSVIRDKYLWQTKSEVLILSTNNTLDTTGREGTTVKATARIRIGTPSGISIGTVQSDPIAIR